MRNKLKLMLLGMALVVLTACGSAETPSQSTNASNTDQASDIEAIEESGVAEEAEEAEEAQAAEEPEAVQEPEVVYPDTFNLNDVLQFPGNFEVSMVSSEFATRVDPPKPAQFFSYYEVKDADKVYVHAVFHVKNLGGQSLRADRVLDLELTYDGKYKYTGFSTMESDGGSDFTYTNISSIAPLTSRVMHYLIEVPKEVQDSGKSLSYTLTLDNKEVTTDAATAGGEVLVMAEEIEIAEITDWQQFEVLQTDQTVTSGEYAELTVKQAELTTKVSPPNPGMFHSYYEVKDSNHIYAHLTVSLKNLSPIGIDADEALQVELLYDNKYKYTGFATIEEGGGEDFTYTNIVKIDPLATETLHYIFEIPAAFKDTDAPLVFTVTADEVDYSYTMVR